MNQPETYPCKGCGEQQPQDTVIWSDIYGHLTMNGDPYCDECLPVSLTGLLEEAVEALSPSGDPEEFALACEITNALEAVEKARRNNG